MTPEIPFSATFSMPHDPDCFEVFLTERDTRLRVMAVHTIPMSRCNPNLHFVTVHYRFHPLAGQSFRCIRVSLYPSPAYLIELHRRRFFLPVWMTEDWAAHVDILPSPQIEVDHLLAISDVVNSSSAQLKPSSCILPEGLNPQEEHDDGNSASVSNSPRRVKRRSPSTTRGRRRDRPSRGDTTTSGSRCRDNRRGGTR